MQNFKINTKIFNQILSSINHTNTSFKYLEEYDKNDNMVHYKDTFGNEVWYTPNKKCHTFYFKESNGNKYQKAYNAKGELISFKFYI